MAATLYITIKHMPSGKVRVNMQVIAEGLEACSAVIVIERSEDWPKVQRFLSMVKSWIGEMGVLVQIVEVSLRFDKHE